MQYNQENVLYGFGNTPPTMMVNTSGRYFAPQVQSIPAEKYYFYEQLYHCESNQTNNYYDNLNPSEIYQCYNEPEQIPIYQYQEQNTIPQHVSYLNNWDGQYFTTATDTQVVDGHPASLQSIGIEPIKISLHEVYNGNGELRMQYDDHEALIQYDEAARHHEYMESLKEKIRNKQLDLSCHICNYEFKSYPRLIRHMETKRHAIQIERYKAMNIPSNSTPVTVTDTTETIEFPTYVGIETILDELLNDIGDDSNYFNDIELSNLEILDAF